MLPAGVNTLRVFFKNSVQILCMYSLSNMTSRFTQLPCLELLTHEHHAMYVTCAMSFGRLSL